MSSIVRAAWRTSKAPPTQGLSFPTGGTLQASSQPEDGAGGGVMPNAFTSPASRPIPNSAARMRLRVLNLDTGVPSTHASP